MPSLEDVAAAIAARWRRTGRDAAPARATEAPGDRRRVASTGEHAALPTSADRLAPDLPAPTDAERTPAEASAARWLVHDAGLVLLHPWLPRLLEAIGCLDGSGRRVADGALPRAAAMLGWLSGGRDRVHEFELGLARVLLGLAPSPDDALALGAPAVEVDDAMRGEGESLLGAVVAHWGALGGTSAEGLRRSFIARDGLLWQEGGAWRLHVEPQAFDLLLQRLPWALGIVKLPWMAAPLHVEWGAP